MATIQPVEVPSSGGRIEAGVATVTWATLTETNTTGQGVRVAHFADRTVQMVGTFGGAAVALQGSNDSTDGSNGTWGTLTDPQGNNISKSAAAMSVVMENPLWVRPLVTGGSGVNVNVILVGSTSRR